MALKKLYSYQNLIRFIVVFIGVVACSTAVIPSTGISTPSDTSSNTIQLPIEVIGDAGYTQAVKFSLSSVPTTPAQLRIKCHRCAYIDASTNSDRGPKASVRLNAGQWIGLTDAIATVDAPERAVGGIAGGWHTVRLTIPVSGLTTGENILEFRFNGTDSFTSGYRILEFNILDASGQAILPTSLFSEQNPDSWPVVGTAADIAAGQQLWQLQNSLKESPLNSRIMKASCADCHATSGRDLKYFGFSDWSIQARSTFHGLTEAQGRQIASYIRSLPVPSLGRPWNPPYQPGPGLDSKPEIAWAAGAGLSSVLDQDSEMQSVLFPNGINSEAIATTKTMNVREMPIAIQLPDWNDWLPAMHPEDIWGDYFANSTTTVPNPKMADVSGSYQKLIAKLANEGPDSLIETKQIDPLFLEFIRAGAEYFLVNDQGNGLLNVPHDISPEFADVNLKKWTSVKTWDLMHSYELESKGQEVYGPQAETRTWLGMARSVFEIAPHRAASNIINFAWQTPLVGKYASTAWYHLQLILTPGHREGSGTVPVDWNYHPSHISDLSLKVSGPKQPFRLIQAFAKMYQEFDNSKGASDFIFRQTHPVRYLNHVFSDLPSVQRSQLYNAILGALMAKLEKHEVSEWPRKSAGRDRYLEDADYVPVVVEGSLIDAHHKGRYADCWYTMIPRFREMGVEPTLITRMIDWGELMWPLGNWNALR